ncbi:MAG: hypothetical protein J0I47_08000 [Sphingomonas sp.]|uniref:hypothetical protein n=1 Tax=Sphingomonas sp. TaxID=28214 RepID=UPI001AC107D6|nr:hypothetical protein [Sphingomonas sp.]MBN8808164.1 hypothetical protein [Sphingomonas sp.]
MLWLMAMGWQAAADVDTAMAHYRALTRATIECPHGHADDVVVCQRRDADRWRVPLVELDLSDPRNEPVMSERERLLARTNNCREKSTFLVGCGKAGIGVSTASGVKLLGERRPLAP